MCIHYSQRQSFSGSGTVFFILIFIDFIGVTWVNKIIQVSLSGWLASLGIILFRSIQAVANDKISFFFMTEYYSIV